MGNVAVQDQKKESVEKAKQDIQGVQKTLESMMPQLANALPSHIKPERMIRVALTAIQNTPKLLECNRNSFYLAVLRAAQLGLEPDGILGQAYLLPYGENVQLIPGYKGLIDLARRSGEVSNIIAKEVYKGDEFSVDFSQEIPFVHKPKLDGERGEITHFWAMARFKDGGFHWDYMTLAEVNSIRDGSSGWKTALKYAKRDKNGEIKEVNSPWYNHFTEMGKKTVIRRIAKFLPMSVQRAAMVEDLVDSGKRFTTDTFGEIVLDHSDENVIDGTAQTVEVKTHAGKLDQFAGASSHNPETEEVIDQGAGNSSPPSQPSPDSSAEASLDDYLHDIRNAPNHGGLSFKVNQAMELFKSKQAHDAVNKAMDERQKQLAEHTEKAANDESIAKSSKKLFEKPSNPQAA